MELSLTDLQDLEMALVSRAGRIDEMLPVVGVVLRPSYEAERKRIVALWARVLREWESRLSGLVAKSKDIE